MDDILLYKLLLEQIKYSCPYKSGNLKTTIKGTINPNGGFKIEVGGQRAPYMPFTNEKWVSPKWNGKKNPNENWWGKAIKQILHTQAFENVEVRIYRD